MSLPRKGSRTVTVGDHRYRWHVRRSPTDRQATAAAPMCVAIERIADEPGTVLLVDLRVSRPDNWTSPHQTALKPATVRAIIAAALGAGWQPERPGAAYRFAYGLIKHRP